MILLDSMVLSELGSKSKDPNVVEWFHALNANQIQIPAFAIYESQRGINKLRREKKTHAADEIEGWIDNLIAAGV